MFVGERWKTGIKLWWEWNGWEAITLIINILHIILLFSTFNRSLLFEGIHLHSTQYNVYMHGICVYCVYKRGRITQVLDPMIVNEKILDWRHTCNRDCTQLGRIFIICWRVGKGFLPTKRNSYIFIHPRSAIQLEDDLHECNEETRLENKLLGVVKLLHTFSFSKDFRGIGFKGYMWEINCIEIYVQGEDPHTVLVNPIPHTKT